MTMENAMLPEAEATVHAVVRYALDDEHSENIHHEHKSGIRPSPLAFMENPDLLQILHANNALPTITRYECQTKLQNLADYKKANHDRICEELAQSAEQGSLETKFSPEDIEYIRFMQVRKGYFQGLIVRDAYVEVFVPLFLGYHPEDVFIQKTPIEVCEMINRLSVGSRVRYHVDNWKTCIVLEINEDRVKFGCGQDGFEDSYDELVENAIQGAWYLL